MRNLRLVQGREHCKHTDAHPRKETAAIHIVNVLSAGLDRASKEEDDATDEDGYTSAYPVGEGADVDVPVRVCVLIEGK